MDLPAIKNQKFNTVNFKLKSRILSLEKQALENNVLLTRVPKGPWENNQCREKVTEAISWTIPGNHNDLHEAFARATKIPIASCKRVGKYSGHQPRPISAKFINNSDKQLLLESKRKLQKGIYTDQEYPKEVQRQRNILQPILRLASKLPEYKGKCKLGNNTLKYKENILT